ncbi:MAG: alpha/beta fold hydrolase [Hyphomicrobiales bacterium]|nr:alpha/beta fold hydrolase [Hyphomicrobiales bacterium]
MARITANGIAIEAEIDGADNAPPILMIRGLGTQLIDWPDALWRGFVAAGFRAVRYDNRDAGLSQKFGPCEMSADAAANWREAPPAYTLFDMAADAVGVLDALGIERAHILGGSMGGMIAQIVAGRYPERTSSLVSIMSSAGEIDPTAGPQEALDALWEAWPPAADPEAVIEKSIRDARLFGSRTYRAEEADLRAGAIASYARCYCPGGIVRHRAAVLGSGDRTDLLRRIACPSLIIHGDEDPLIPASSGRRAAELIPGARFRLIAGMGHDYPEPLIPEIVSAIVAHCREADVADA